MDEIKLELYSKINNVLKLFEIVENTMDLLSKRIDVCFKQCSSMNEQIKMLSKINELQFKRILELENTIKELKNGQRD